MVLNQAGAYALRDNAAQSARPFWETFVDIDTGAIGGTADARNVRKEARTMLMLPPDQSKAQSKARSKARSPARYSAPRGAGPAVKVLHCRSAPRLATTLESFLQAGFPGSIFRAKNSPYPFVITYGTLVHTKLQLRRDGHHEFPDAKARKHVPRVRHAMDENAFAQASSLLQRMPVNRVAVFRALRLGDMLCAVPALRALRATLPHANITLVGLPWAADFARRFAHYVDDFIPFPGHPALPEQSFRTADVPAFQEALCNRRFELAIQMHGSGEVSNGIVASFQAQAVCGFSAVHDPRANSAQTFMAFPEHGPEIRRLLVLMDFLGAKCRDQDLEFPITDADLAELTDWPACASALEAGDYICIHPGASNISKCWPAERFAHVADALQREFALPVVLTGSAAERPLTQAVAEHMRGPAINAALPLSIGAMAALFSRARLLVCNDTGVSHIAAGLKLPSVVIFGQAEMERWAPLNAQLHRSIRDPEGKQAAEVLRQARSLLSLAEPATPSPWQALRAP